VSILKENVEAFAEFGAAEDERTMRDDFERDRPRAPEAKTRKCLVCQTPFPSAWAGERVCRRCKATSAWRSGALG
jgi:hypothetical protein